MKATNHITNTTMAKKNESNFITDPVQAYFMAKLENVIRFSLGLLVYVFGCGR